MSIVFSRNRNAKPMTKSIMAAPSHGFHIFHAHTENLCLLAEFELMAPNDEALIQA